MSGYGKEILERNLHPLYRGEMNGENVITRELYNASCGDKIVEFLRVVDGEVTEASWEGEGCAIAQASADFWAEKVVGKKFGEIGELAWENVKELESVKNMPGRINCVKLPWGFFPKENVVK